MENYPEAERGIGVPATTESIEVSNLNHTVNRSGIWSRGWYRWGIFAGTWAIFGILFSIQAVTRRPAQGGRPIPWTDAITIGFAEMAGWVLMALVAFAVAERVPIQRGRMIRFILVYLASFIGAVVLRATWQLLVFSLTGRAQLTFWQAIVQGIALKALMYSLLLGVGYALVYARQLHERELREAQLETELLSAHLNVLKMQLQPHFLFNTLNSISSLMYADVGAADRMVARLADFLRQTLRTIDTQEVTLQEEMNFLTLYLDIERTRLRDRLEICLDVDEGARVALVPHLILQPLVENAIGHAIAPRVEGGSVTILAKRQGDRLQLVVRDDGPGLQRDPNSTGLGLRNTRQRLQHLYPGTHRFSIRNGPEGGAEVEVEFPYKPIWMDKESAASNGDPT
jgi:two-component system, LytTR family, sensor kinase